MSTLHPATKHPHCPTCGSALPDNNKEIFTQIVNIAATKTEHRILFYLARRFGTRVSTSALTDFVYSDDPNGGPPSANNVIRVTNHKLRQKLLRLGLTIRGYGGRGTAGGETILGRVSDLARAA